MHTPQRLFSGINVNGLETLKGVDWDVGDVSVQFVGAVFVFVALAVETNPDSVLDVAHSMFPHRLVQTRIHANILTHVMTIYIF